MAAPIGLKFELPLERRAHTRTVLVVDAACDLPAWYVKANHIVVLPMRVLGKDLDALDTRDVDATQAFYATAKEHSRRQLSVRALSPAETQRFLLSQVGANRDNLLQLTSASGSSMVYHVCGQVAPSIMLLHRRARKHTNFRTKFRMWVMDSRTMFTGEAILAVAATRAMQRHDAPKRIVEHLRVVRRSVHTLVLPTSTRALPPTYSNHDESSLRKWVERFRTKPARAPVLHTFAKGTTTFAVGRDYDESAQMIFSAANDAMTRGLDVPTIIVSYAGPLADIESRPDYQKLIERGRAKRIDIMLAPMSMVGTASMGAGAISVGFASKRFLS